MTDRQKTILTATGIVGIREAVTAYLAGAGVPQDVAYLVGNEATDQLSDAWDRDRAENIMDEIYRLLDSFVEDATPARLGVEDAHPGDPIKIGGNE